MSDSPATTPRPEPLQRPARIAVLASGGGSNLQCLIDHFAAAGAGAGRIYWVGSDKSTAGALTRAAAASIPTHVIADPSDGAALVATLRAAQADLLVLAGYLKLIPAEVVQAFHGRLINVHPALLPAFGGPGMYGQRIHSAVLAHGATVTGVTVHFVDEAYDRGPIIAQWPVPVLPGDTPATLSSRVLAIEHRLLPLCVEAVASGQLQLGADGRVHGHLHAINGEDTGRWRYALTPDNPADTSADTSATGTAFATDLARLFPR